MILRVKNIDFVLEDLDSDTHYVLVVHFFELQNENNNSYLKRL